MNSSAPRSIDQYLRRLREELAGADSALIQDALYDAEEYLRAEVAAHPDKSESDVLELIASTYGAPDEVAAAYRDTEVKVKAAMATPRTVWKTLMRQRTPAMVRDRSAEPRARNCCQPSPPSSSRAACTSTAPATAGPIGDSWPLMRATGAVSASTCRSLAPSSRPLRIQS